MERNDPQRNQCKNLYADRIRLKWSSAIQFHSIPFSYFFSFYHFPLYHHHYHHHSAAHSRLRKPSLLYHNDWNICIQNDFLSLSLFLSLFVSLLVLIPPISFSFYRSIDLSIYLSISYLPFKEYSTCEYILSVCIEKDLSTVIILLQ